MLRQSNLYSTMRGLLTPLLAICFALLVSIIIIALLGKSPITFLTVLFQGAFGSKTNLINTLSKTIPLVFTGLSVGLGFRAGLFNIGSEGQLYMGGIGAAYVGALSFSFPRFLHLPLALIIGFAMGALWGVIPGWLKAKKGVHEVITTIMMNYVAIYFTSYLISGPLSAGVFTRKTKDILPTARLGTLWRSGTAELSYGILIALGVAVFIYWLLFSTKSGYEVRAVGLNPLAARFAGVGVSRNIVLTLGICGGLAGLGGAIEVTGLHHTFYGQFSPGYGYDGIAVALLAKNHPVGVILTALLFASLRSADRWLQIRAGIPKDIVLIIQALVILFIASEAIIRAKIIPHLLKKKKTLLKTEG